MVASLPLELVEAIIANLDDDKGALRACALVCLMWTATSQQHIFRTFVVIDLGYLDRLMHLRNHPRLRPLVVDLIWLSSLSCSADDVQSLFPRVRRLFCNMRVQWTVISSLPLLDHLQFGDEAHFAGGDVQATEATSESAAGHSEHGGLAITSLRCVGGTYVKLLKDLQVRVRADSMKTLHLHLPTAIGQDAPWFRQFLTSLRGLDKLVLDICMLLQEADLNLGTIGASTLRLRILPDNEFMPFVFGLLRSTSFPQLRSLLVELVDTDANRRARRARRSDHLHREDTTEVVFNPFNAGGESVHSVQPWVLNRSLAAQLESIHISMSPIDVLAHATAFFELFGEANRPEVLRVSPERVRLEG